MSIAVAANNGQSPCSNITVPNKPDTVSLADNINRAERSKWLIFAAPRLSWFYSQTRSGGPWDYKLQGRSLDDLGNYHPSPYVDFGNFNFGMTGGAAGIELQVLLRGAGAYQKYVTHNSRPEWGGPTDLHGPYGDDPADQAEIIAGFNYYKYGCYK